MWHRFSLYMDFSICTLRWEIEKNLSQAKLDRRNQLSQVFSTLCMPVANRVKRFITHARKRYKLTQLFMII